MNVLVPFLLIIHNESRHFQTQGSSHTRVLMRMSEHAKMHASKAMLYIEQGLAGNVVQPRGPRCSHLVPSHSPSFQPPSDLHPRMKRQSRYHLLTGWVRLDSACCNESRFPTGQQLQGGAEWLGQGWPGEESLWWGRGASL